MPNQETQNSWIEHGKKATQKFELSIASVRQEKRSTWSQIILLSSAILGFSATFITLKFSMLPAIILIFSWLMFTLTLILGVWLIIKDSSEYLLENTKLFLFSQDDVDRETKKTNNKITKEEYDHLFIALMYLRSSDRSFFSDMAKEIFEKYKEELSSWKLIKDPEKYYFCRNKRRELINKYITENNLFIFFVLSTITLLVGLVLSKFI